MSGLLTETYIAMVTASLAGVVWLVRLEGRVAAHVKEDELIHRQLQEAFERVEMKLDRLSDHMINERK